MLATHHNRAGGGRPPARRWRTGQRAQQAGPYRIECDRAKHRPEETTVDIAEAGKKFPPCPLHQSGATYRPAPPD